MEEEKEDSFAQKLHALEDGQHLFFERTFKTLTYCNVCTSLLWGLVRENETIFSPMLFFFFFFFFFFFWLFSSSSAVHVRKEDFLSLSAL